MKRIVVTLLGILLLSQPAFAGFKEHFDLAQEYLANYQYSSAITEFKNALKINYLDNSARIGLVQTTKRTMQKPPTITEAHFFI